MASGNKPYLKGDYGKNPSQSETQGNVSPEWRRKLDDLKNRKAGDRSSDTNPQSESRPNAIAPSDTGTRQHLAERYNAQPPQPEKSESSGDREIRGIP